MRCFWDFYCGREIDWESAAQTIKEFIVEISESVKAYKRDTVLLKQLLKFWIVLYYVAGQYVILKIK